MCTVSTPFLPVFMSILGFKSSRHFKPRLLSTPCIAPNNQSEHFLLRGTVSVRKIPENK